MLVSQSLFPDPNSTKMADLVITLVVSPILQEALSRVTSFLDGQIMNAVANDSKTQLEIVKHSLAKLKDVLDSAEKLQRSTEFMRLWLRKVEDLSYDLVDLLEEITHNVPVGEKFRKMMKSLDQIERDTTCINLLNSLGDESSVQSEDFPVNPQLLERGNDVAAVEESLADLRSQHSLSCVCIVGMPGVGKTAIARSICQKAREERHYDVAAWISVREKFEVRAVFSQMLESLDNGYAGMKNFDAIVLKLKRSLVNKTFLLFLDDVRDVDAFLTFITVLGGILEINADMKSSVVVTTNDKWVASSIMGIVKTVPIHKHELQKLSTDKCWSVMINIFAKSQQIASIASGLTETEKIEIAEQCGGLPLVASIMGEKLCQHTDRSEWLAVSNNRAWDSPYRKSISSELKKSSFDRLHSHSLKKCFAYCSIFPRGHEIDKDDLVQLWLAKGFIQQENDGYQNFDFLVSNYLLEVDEIEECGNVKTCKMHDEMHNLAMLVSDHETYIWSGNGPIGGTSSIRHVRVMSSANLEDITKERFKRLHSLFLEVDVDLHSMAEDLQHLRSLKVVASKKRKFTDLLKGSKDVKRKLPESLAKSKHVKYLDISEIEKMSISDLGNFYQLQTLRFMRCNSLQKLSGSVNENLVTLRHIYFNDERHMPSSIGNLTSLQTLPLFVVGTERGRGIIQLGGLEKLRGGLKICKLEQVSEEEATRAKLKSKVHLSRLQFLWSGDRASSNDDEEGVLEGLRPGSNLKSLTIENYKGSKFPSWMKKINDASIFCLKSLVELKLINCDECENIPNLGLFPELKVVTIGKMPKVIRMGSEFYDIGSNAASSSRDGGQSITLYPALRKLKLYDMEMLEEWMELNDKVVFPCLEELQIRNCPVLASWRMDRCASRHLSELSIQSSENPHAIPTGQKFLDISGCPNLKRYLLIYGSRFDRIDYDGQMMKP